MRAAMLNHRDGREGRGAGDSVPLFSKEIDNRIAELEIENERLHRLVAELLMKNQKLRESD